MSALLAVVLDIDGVADRTPAGLGATEAAAAVLRSALPEAAVEVVTRAGRLAELLQTPCDLVLLHDPGHPLDDDTVLAVLQEWHDDGECVAAVGCAEGSDPHEHVDGNGRVMVTLDRDAYRALTGPLVVTHAALAATVAVAGEAGDDVAAAVELLDRTVGVRRVVPNGSACRPAR